MKIGYARVSSTELYAEAQCRALEAAGCQKIILERIFGLSTRRPRLDELLPRLGRGDVLMVARLDRLGSSLRHLVELARDLGTKGVGLVALSEKIDTTKANSHTNFLSLSVLAEYDRAITVERARAGLAACRGQGLRIGRPRSLTMVQLIHARVLIDHGEKPEQVATSLKVDRDTLYRGFERLPRGRDQDFSSLL